MVSENKSSTPDSRHPEGQNHDQTPAETSSSRTASIPPGVWCLLAAVIVFGVGVRILLSVKTDFSIGDAYIIFRFAEQFAAGNGLVFNAGESVGGNTSPLHTFLLGLGACSGVAVPWVARILGTMCDVAALFLMWGIFRWRGGIRSPWLQMAALAVDYAVLPNQFHETNHPNFQLLKVFGTQKSATGVGLADWSYSIYQRSDSTNPPVTK